MAHDSNYLVDRFVVSVNYGNKSIIENTAGIISYDLFFHYEKIDKILVLYYIIEMLVIK